MFGLDVDLFLDLPDVGDARRKLELCSGLTLIKSGVKLFCNVQNNFTL
jgi:murein endopeptidase